MNGNPLQSPESAYCQRWDGGKHSWRHVSEGGFDARRFEVKPIPESVAKPFVQRHHYAGSYPAARFAYGLTTDDTDLAIDGTMIGGRALVGVAVLSVPMSTAALTNVFPGLHPFEQSLELGRFVLTDTPANAESWFLSRMFHHAADDGIAGIVSFADPMARTRRVADVDADGRAVERTEVLTPGHVGLIYQATNARPCGRSTPRTLAYLPSRGLVLSARTLQKIRAGERGSDAAERTLVDYGATPRSAGQDAGKWLKEALHELRVEAVRHPGNFRYAWAIGAGRRKATIGMPETRRPKPDLDRIQQIPA